MSTDEPHVLVLTGDDDEPGRPNAWTAATLTCPYRIPSALMPCAVLDRCSCPPGPDGVVTAPCPTSATGTHTMWEGEPYRPAADCWPVNHADGLDEAAYELDLPAGTHEVWPECVDDRLVLHTVAPDWAVHADPPIFAATVAALQAVPEPATPGATP